MSETPPARLAISPALREIAGLVSFGVGVGCFVVLCVLIGWLSLLALGALVLLLGGVALMVHVVPNESESTQRETREG